VLNKEDEKMVKKKNIPVFILAGGLGTRISEETHLKPKPMIEIGETPILLHIMRWYYSFGFNDFVICAGYRSWEIKNFFLNYDFRLNHLVIDHRASETLAAGVLGTNLEQEKWRVRVIDTGLETMTGGRLARAIDEVSKEDKFTDFALTYGDGLCDINLDQELSFHEEHGLVGTVLGVPPVARFGELDISADAKVVGFLEKPENRQGLINGGFFFFKKEFRKYLSDSKDCVLERKPLSSLAEDRQLMMYKHTGFWMPMDTLRDKVQLQQLWDSGKAPWSVPNHLLRQ
jgi:glucose-1-phosphate cytidylyltransferase